MSDNFRVRVADVPGAVKMLGRLISADLSQMQFTYTSGGFFLPGDLIEGGTSGATGIAVSDNGSDTVVIGNITGTFSNSELIACDARGIIATVTSIDPADQLIALYGGSKYYVSDVVITNASASLTNAADGMLNTNPARAGSIIMSTSWGNELLTQLVSPNNLLNQTSALLKNSLSLGGFPGIGCISSYVTCGNSLYFSLGTPQGAPATADIYVIGFVLN